MFGIPPLSERHHLPGYVLPLLHLTLVITLSLPPKLRALAAPAIVLPALALPSHTTGKIIIDYWASSAVVCWLLAALDFIVLSNADRDFWRVEGRGGEGGKKRLKGAAWSWERLMWSADIWVSSRGAGWSWEVKNVPPKPPLGYPAR